MRLFVNLDTPLAMAVVAAADLDRRRPQEELLALAEAELRRRGLFNIVDTGSTAPDTALAVAAAP